MKGTYDHPTGAYLETYKIKGRRLAYEVTFISVPREHRGQGIGRELLREALADADKEGAVLELCVSSGGKMTDADLARWYERNGFEQLTDLTWRREPYEHIHS
jgi:ribosomal protein S18 acetylase RimI-like enzyme